MSALKQRLPDVATALVIALCAIWYYHANIAHQITGLAGPSDFSEYYRAAQSILNGRSPYENPAWFYPPLTAFLIAPFALTDYHTARWIWFVLCQASLLAAGFLLWRAAGRGRLLLCCVACVWAFGGSTRETFTNGQISPLLVLLLVLAYTQRSMQQGVFTGIGFAVKYIPGIVAFAILLNRGRRALAAFAAVALIAVLVPWGVLALAFSGPRTPSKAHYWMGTPAAFNWSIPGVVLRVLDRPAPGHRLPYNWEFGNVAADLHPLPRTHELLSVAAALAVLLTGVIILTVISGGALDDRQLPWAMIALVSLSLAAMPVSWFHYQILQYPGLALLLAHSLRERAWTIAACTVVCAALLNPLPVAALDHWTAAPPATLYLWTSVAPAACLGVFALALRNVRRKGSARAPIPSAPS